MNKDIEKFIDLMFDSNIEEEIKKESKILEIVKERNDLKQRIDKTIEEINYMITNADITEISAIKLKQILGDKENE